jgi:hypothetical protein
MKIAFFSEGNFNGKVSSEHVGRTDINWYFALDAFHINIHQESFFEYGEFDLGIYIIPKKNPVLGLEVLYKMQNRCKKVAVMQEANHDNFQDNTVQTQIDYIRFLNNVDAIFCHNEIDVKYYKGIFPDKHVFINQTLMLVDNLDKSKIVKEHYRAGTMIGGNWGKWYNGLDSFIIADLFGEPLYAPSMGRKTDDEDLIDSIHHVPYQNWNSWMYSLSQCKQAVHLMRTPAAGSFSLNCAFLKLPCIGWDNIDTQRLLFPELSCEVGDMESARKIAKHLKNNNLFFNHVKEYAFKVYSDIYMKENYLNQFKENYEILIQ